MEQQPTPAKSNQTTMIAVGVVVALCCACLLIIGAAGVYFYERVPDIIETTTPDFPTLDPGTATPPPVVTRPPVEDIPTTTLETLGATIVPENDPYDLACRLQGLCNVSPTLGAPAASLTVGTEQTFWVMNSNTNDHFQVDATLRYITPHTYFWVENGADYNEDDLKNLMDTFEEKIYPTDREFFGSEWNPGVDGDPHIYILYVGNIGFSVAGYFSSQDEYNPAIKEYSNGHETFVIASTQDLGDDYTYSTLAHEFVHMIQWPTDRNDASWMIEGFAEVGAFINGYGVGGADWAYTTSPDLQLNDWADPNSPDFGTHYGQSFLYLAYFLDRFGPEATRVLSSDPEDDLAGIDGTLAELNITDPLTGKLITADDVFMDWAAAMFLLDGSVGDGRYTYHNYPSAPQTFATETVYSCPSEKLSRNVHQYGIDYIGIDCSGEFTLHFEGSTAAGLLPVDAHSGRYAFWSNKGNESDMTLTREFDLTGVSGPVTLSFWTWYDLEAEFDYVYLEVSEDGQSWDIIETPSGTDEDPTGSSYGWGYNDKTNVWIEEQVDLSAYAGKKIQVRFEYVTDALLNGEGLLLDDVRIDAIGYSSDFEADDGGWVGAGFVRVENVLPQTFRLILIREGDQTTVEYIQVNADQTADIPLSLQSGETATLIVTGTTRFTRELANYSIEIR
ncbi:MAG: choice-of-anchor J domain-containing protein [Chloroflexota bacterium]